MFKNTEFKVSFLKGGGDYSTNERKRRVHQRVDESRRALDTFRRIREREREVEHNKMVDASSSEETPSETVAALFPVFLIAILSCFLFPVTLYRIGRRFGLLSFLAVAGEDDEEGESKKMKKKNAGLSSSSSLAGGKKTNDIQIKAKDSPWAKAFEESVHQSRQSMKRRMVSADEDWRSFSGGFFFRAALLGEADANGGEEVRSVRYFGTLDRCDAVGYKKSVQEDEFEVPPGQKLRSRNDQVFSESVAPAYKTLTDDVARENFEKHGHPDGRQSTKLGVALPEELFGRGRLKDWRRLCCSGWFW